MDIILVGQRVEYWARRQGEPAHLNKGTVIQVTGRWTRVRLDGDHVVPVQSVEMKRLKSAVPEPVPQPEPVKRPLTEPERVEALCDAAIEMYHEWAKEEEAGNPYERHAYQRAAHAIQMLKEDITTGALPVPAKFRPRPASS